MPRDGTPHLDALLGVLDGFVKGRLEDAHALGGDAHAAMVEGRMAFIDACALPRPAGFPSEHGSP